MSFLYLIIVFFVATAAFVGCINELFGINSEFLDTLAFASLLVATFFAVIALIPTAMMLLTS